MAGTSGKSLSQLKAERAKLISQGKTLSTSKELGKIENAIKVLEPNKYDAKQVASAKKALASSTKPGSSSNYSSSGGGSVDLNNIFNTSDISGANSRLSQLDADLAEKQKAKAEQASFINDNPFYSEATRVGKISKLDEKANADINNLLTEKATEEGRLANLKNDVLTQYNINLQQQQLSAPQVQFYQDAYGNQIKLMLDPRTGKTLGTENLGGGKAQTAYSADDVMKYLVSTGQGTSSAYDTKNTPKSTLQSPPQSGKPGAVVEYPKGTGIYWTASADGTWR
jgi:hypothetical protein